MTCLNGGVMAGCLNHHPVEFCPRSILVDELGYGFHAVLLGEYPRGLQLGLCIQVGILVFSRVPDVQGRSGRVGRPVVREWV